MTPLENIPPIEDFRKIINSLLIDLKKEYSSLKRGSQSEPENKLCRVTHELREIYKQDKKAYKKYGELRDYAVEEVFKITINCKEDGFNYGKY